MACWWSGNCSANLQLTSEMMAVIVSMQKSNIELIGAIMAYFAKVQETGAVILVVSRDNGAENRNCEYGKHLAIRRGWEGRHREAFRFFPQLTIDNKFSL